MITSNPRSIRSAGTLGLGLALAWATPSRATAQEGGIEVFAAATLFEQGTRVSLSHIYKRRSGLFRGSDEVPDPLDRTSVEQRFVAAVDHGFRPDLTVSALIPFVSKDLDTDAGDLDSSGLGDVAVLAKFRAYKVDWTRSSLNVSVIGGLETPTGDTVDREDGVRLAPGLQPGSGSWDPFTALSMNLNQGRFRLDALALYKFNTEGAQDFEAGDFLSLELGGTYRFLHTKYPGPTANARLGLQWRHEGKAKQDGATVPDTGLDELTIRTGLTWHPAPNLDLTLSVDVPVHQDYEGTQLGLDLRTFIAIGFRF